MRAQSMLGTEQKGDSSVDTRSSVANLEKNLYWLTVWSSLPFRRLSPGLHHLWGETQG